MGTLPTTTSILLETLQDPGAHEAWRLFDGRYRPVLFAFAKRLGLSEADAREAAQDALADFAQEIRAGRYDAERGRLRAWLFTIARTRAARRKLRVAQEAGARGESALAQLPDDHTLSALWEEQWRRALLVRAWAELREKAQLDPSTLDIFEALTVEGRSADEVARERGMTANAVYQAKFRAMEKLRAILARLEDDG